MDRHVVLFRLARQQSASPPEPKPGVGGELWAVHGGGFYHKQKYVVAPPVLPEHLHWFKWEAYFTWISGILLFSVIYYLGAELFLIDRAKLGADRHRSDRAVAGVHGRRVGRI